MPSLEFFVVASSVSVDQRSNRLSILEVIDELLPVRFPARMPRVAAMTIWTLSEEDQGQDFQATLRVTSPGFDETPEFRQNFKGEGSAYRMLFHLLNVPVFKAGKIVFEIKLNGEHKAGHEIRVATADESATDDGFLIYTALGTE
jgi:hypothetical protein